MENTVMYNEYQTSRDIAMLRLFILVVGILIALFMISDLRQLPKELTSAYINNRLYIQLPIILSLLALTFHSRFNQYAQPAFLLSILGLTFSNYYLIYRCWELAAFSFPYDGTLMYAFFGFFVLGIKFRYALLLMVLSTLGFVFLTHQSSIYGERTSITIGAIVGSLFIGVFGRHHIDQLLKKLEEANGLLLALSSKDSLTGLLNRRAFMKDALQLFELQRRSGKTMTVFMMDLDHFKHFNDRYGHQEGDRAIRCQADIMRQVFKRQTDILGRYGGEEFIAITSS